MILFIKHVDVEGPDTLGVYFSEMGYELGICELHRGDKLPYDPVTLDAVVSLGGPMNVYEETKYPFLRDEDVFLKKVITKQIPFLGICLGSQLLSKASGGKVTRSLKSEIGWFNVKLTKAGTKDQLFFGWPKELDVYQWHGDMCVPPEGSAVLANSECCPVQSFRYGANAYGLQFHAEITDKSIDEWCRENEPGDHANREIMLQRYHEVKEDFHRYGRILCDNFSNIMQGR